MVVHDKRIWLRLLLSFLFEHLPESCKHIGICSVGLQENIIVQGDTPDSNGRPASRSSIVQVLDQIDKRYFLGASCDDQVPCDKTGEDELKVCFLRTLVAMLTLSHIATCADFWLGKDMILVSGFNVFPAEIEEVITNHPKVLWRLLQLMLRMRKVKWFVIKQDPSLTEEELGAYINENLTGYKRPKYIEFLDDLPKSNVGKILRKNLRR